MKRMLFVGGLLVALSVAGKAWAQDGQFVFAFRAAPELPAPDLGPTDCIENDGPRWPPGSDAIAGGPGTVARAGYYCVLEQLDPCEGGIVPHPQFPPNAICDSGTPGAQGWYVSFTASGCDAVILEASTGQTDIAPGSIEECEGGPNWNGGFEATSITSDPGDHWATTAVVLHLTTGTTLDPTGLNTEPATGPEQNPATVCRFLVEYTIPNTLGDSCDMTLKYVDRFSIDNRVTQNGQGVRPLEIEKTVTVTAVSRQVPGDCNQDGALDIGDAVCVVGALFRGIPSGFPCGDGFSTDPSNIALLDWQPDGAVDVSDAVSMLDFLFRALEPHPLGVPGTETTGCVTIPGCPHNNSTGCP